MNKNNNQSLQSQKGWFELAILMMLEKKPMYGYELTKCLQDSHVFIISDGSIYPILKRLTSNDYIDVFTKEFDGRMRKYYQLTPLGKAEIQEKWSDLEMIYHYFKNLKDRNVNDGQNDD